MDSIKKVLMTIIKVFVGIAIVYYVFWIVLIGWLMLS